MKSKHDDIADDIIKKRQNGTFILTYDHRQQYLDKLNPDNFTTNELIDFNKEFSEEDDPELAKAEIEGIKALRDSLELLNDDTKVILLSIG
jgi:translation initiation factor 2B subunit (eIF-2B alpha/beta/delta family)